MECHIYIYTSRNASKGREGGLRFICASCQHFVFESKWGVSFMEDDFHADPVEPSIVAAVEVVNLVEDDVEREDFFQSLLRGGQDAASFPSPQLDNLPEGTFVERDTSLVETTKQFQNVIMNLC